ncbi:MAG: polysaccharide biosynthesis protein [Nitrospinae bacterium]|nr:polysaccharide biosynthesis protein [Nitrospinota bacterium]
MQINFIKRTLFFLFFDILIITFSLYFALSIRFEFDLDSFYSAKYLNWLPIFITIKLSYFYYFRLYHLSWRYAGLGDLFNILKATTISSFFMILVIYFMRLDYFAYMPRGTILVDYLLTLLFVSFLRISKRMYYEYFSISLRKIKGDTILLGGGDAGELIVRDIIRTKNSHYSLLGILDDDKLKLGTYIHGIKVIGALKDLNYCIPQFNIKKVIVAIASMNHQELKEIYKVARKNNIDHIKIVTKLHDYQGSVSVKSLDDIKVEDLIGRQEIEIDSKKIGEMIKGKTVLITGSSGSIGGELSHQVSTFCPEKLILFDMDETALNNQSLKLTKLYPELSEHILYVLGNVRETSKLEEVFREYQPDIVFHAAAYKHVPLIESNPKEAVKTNVIGTYNVAYTSLKSNVKKFVMISTDKAVRPTNIMGATKKNAELICQSLNLYGKTEFISVRFGNVLGSRGSVLPLFLDQLQSGGPLTITHEEVTRYFMTIPEAVSLILQSAVIGKDGDIMVLDMGEPLKIKKFAEELIRLHGLEPYKDIDIKVIGLRPGEKLYEELFSQKEKLEVTMHSKIMRSKKQETFPIEKIDEIINELRDVAYSSANNNEVKKLLKQYVEWHDADS